MQYYTGEKFDTLNVGALRSEAVLKCYFAGEHFNRKEKLYDERSDCTVEINEGYAKGLQFRVTEKCNDSQP